MYIKSIVLEGFKSYGQRTEINGFDKEFNAITGLNGTGKSNILDSICFVLGISNLSQVRAASLQDLVYRNGQTGITKATVTITFDNTDKNQCPPGYADYKEITVTRQVIMGGKNKYMINGSNVQNKRVQDLFCSVQLNVNNPNFLIMQGRITKVLNMKPVEILSMIEEAAGTRMYETKKQETNKQIARKDVKLEELGRIMLDEIIPKLHKLREERQHYIDFQNTERELEHSSRVWLAWQCIELGKNTAAVKEQVDSITRDIELKQKTIDQNLIEADKIEKLVQEMHEQIDRESGGKLAEAENILKEHEKKETQKSAAVKSAKTAIVTEEKKLKLLEKSLIDDAKALKTKEAELEKVQGMFTKLKDAEVSDSKALESAQRRYEAASAGLVVGEDGEAATLQEQLMVAKQEESEAGTRIKQSEMELKRCKKLLAEKLQELEGSAGQYAADQQALKNKETALQRLEKQLSLIKYDEGRVRVISQRRVELSDIIRLVQSRVERFESQFPRTAFRYKDPEPNFDRKRVYGLVCKALTVPDPKHCTAIETAAGARLYNVIVDTDVTSKLVLENGQLQQRATMIPLNKIQPSVLPERNMHVAQNLVGSNNVQAALSLITFSPQIRKAMQYIFGTILVCNDMPIANKIAFNRQVNTKCVTIDGDIVDPAGVLSGGSPLRGGSILAAFNELRDEINQLENADREFKELGSEIAKMSAAGDQFQMLKEDIDLKKHELQIVGARLQQTTHFQKQAEIDQLQATINELTKTIAECTQIRATAQKRAAKLQSEISDTTGYKERQLKEAQDDMHRLQKKAEQSRNEWKKREQEFETLNLEISELRTALDASNEQIVAAKSAIQEAKTTLQTLELELAEAHEEVVRYSTGVQTVKKEIEGRTVEIKKTLGTKKNLCTQAEELKLEIQKLEIVVAKHKTELRDWEQKGQVMHTEHEWLRNDDRFMEQASKLEPAEAKAMGERVRQLKESYAVMRRSVNVHAITLLEDEEKQYHSLRKRETIVENDRQALLNLILDLDQKKEKAIQVAWQQVNKDFGSIFTTLLPGASAKLQPVEEGTATGGLEVKVGFGGIWKESLGELSGGQRSLVALSLILAMLLFKPAPLYILDEVDAALDLSHTQNIGNMLKTHFKHSQFIVVSLKDGMFNNANVLFRTRFQDGHSDVLRTVCNQSSR